MIALELREFHDCCQNSMNELPEFVCYGVATIRKLLKMIDLFCKRALQNRRYSAKETCNFKEPTHRSHPIATETGWEIL